MKETNSNFLFTELKQIYQLMTENKYSAEQYFIDDLIDELLRLNNIARKGGLLDLEEAVRKLSRQGNLPKHILKFQEDLFGFIIDGTDGDLVKRYGILRYINETTINLLNELDKLAYIIIIYAVEYIQEGYNPRLAESMLKALLPSRNFLSI